MARLTQHYVSQLSIDELEARLAELPARPGRSIRLSTPPLNCVRLGSAQFELVWTNPLTEGGGSPGPSLRGASRGLYWSARIELQPIQIGTLIRTRLMARRYLAFAIAIYGLIVFVFLSLRVWFEGGLLADSVSPGFLAVTLNVASIVLIGLGFCVWMSIGGNMVNQTVGHLLDAQPVSDREVDALYAA